LYNVPTTKEWKYTQTKKCPCYLVIYLAVTLCLGIGLVSFVQPQKGSRCEVFSSCCVICHRLLSRCQTNQNLTLFFRLLERSRFLLLPLLPMTRVGLSLESVKLFDSGFSMDMGTATVAPALPRTCFSSASDREKTAIQSAEISHQRYKYLPTACEILAEKSGQRS
jgi:hypothetical protein